MQLLVLKKKKWRKELFLVVGQLVRRPSVDINLTPASKQKKKPIVKIFAHREV